MKCRCPYCKSIYDMPDTRRGDITECSKCESEFVIVPYPPIVPTVKTSGPANVLPKIAPPRIIPNPNASGPVTVSTKFKPNIYTTNKSDTLKEIVCKLAPVPDGGESIIRAFAEGGFDAVMPRLNERTEGKRELFTLLRKNPITANLLKSYKVDDQTLDDIYEKLCFGAGMCVSGHWVPASALADAQTLEYILKNKDIGRNEFETICYCLLDYYRDDATPTEELKNLAEIAFDLAHEFVAFRKHINNTVGSIFGMFKKIDYSSIHQKAVELKAKFDLLHETVVDVCSQSAPSAFSGELNEYSTAICEASRILVQKTNMMLKRSLNPKTVEWPQFKQVIKEEEAALARCQISGEKLTKMYRAI